ncbi:MAG TPA: Wzz/FepE/Etk N-terminal domain-containing protein, partial [Isosphaeraceae bacterium]
MDRIIQPYGGPVAGAPARAVGVPLNPVPVAAATKVPGDYLRSLRRRFWLALSVASALIAAGAVVVVRQPNVYRASAQILIETPHFDTILGSIVSNDVGRAEREAAEKYVPNRLALLRSRSL